MFSEDVPKTSYTKDALRPVTAFEVVSPSLKMRLVGCNVPNDPDARIACLRSSIARPFEKSTDLLEEAYIQASTGACLTAL